MYTAKIYFGDANQISKNDRFDSRYTIDGNLLRRPSAVEWAASAWRASRGRPSVDGNGRAADARTKRCRSGWLCSEHEYVVASRGVCCLLLLVGAQSCAPPRPIVLREVCFVRLLTSRPFSSVYVHTSSWLTPSERVYAAFEPRALSRRHVLLATPPSPAPRVSIDR